MIDQAHVRRAEQVASPAFPRPLDSAVLPHQLIRKAARLSTAASVSASASDHAAQVALSGVGDANGSVDENLDLRVGGGADSADFLQRELPGENDAPEARPASLLDACQIVSRALGAEMKRHLRHTLHQFRRQSPILKDQRVCSEAGNAPGEAHRLFHLIVAYESI